MKMKGKSSDYKLLSGLFFRLLPYQILLIAISAVNGIVDSLYASNVIGKTAMSAIGLYNPLNHFLYALSIMMVSGSQMLYGKYLAKDREKINGLFSVNILLATILSVVTSLVLVIGVVTGLTGMMTDEPEDLKMLNDYIIGQVIGIPALVLGQQLFAFLSLENQTRRTMVASIVCFVVNAVLNHVFLIFIPMGTFGLGLSSSIASWVFLAILAVWYLQGKSEWKFSFRNCRWKDGPQIARLGYPGALSRFVEMFRCLIVNALLMEYVGSVGISSFSASNALLGVVWSVPFGMVAVSRMFFTISIGEEDRKSLADAMKIAMTKGLLVLLGIVALLILLAEPLTNLYYHDPSDPVYPMTVMGFRILPLCMPLSLWSLHYASYAQTMEKKAISIIIPIIDGMVGVVLFSFLLIPTLQNTGLYIANVLNGVLCFLVILISAWLTLKRFPRTMEDYLAFPKGFGAEEDERIDITVRNIDEVMNISQQVIAFCEKREIDRRRAFMAGLCMEEMAGNVVTYGFKEDGKDHSVDIRVVHSRDDEIILRIRDNCKAFNPSEHAKMMDPGEEGKNVGIRLVYNVAKSVSYQNLLGMNVLTIKI